MGSSALLTCEITPVLCFAECNRIVQSPPTRPFPRFLARTAALALAMRAFEGLTSRVALAERRETTVKWDDDRGVYVASVRIRDPAIAPRDVVRAITSAEVEQDADVYETGDADAPLLRFVRCRTFLNDVLLV